jgi:hypothetical protein
MRRKTSRQPACGLRRGDGSLRQLLDNHPFDEIATILNGRGITGGRGRAFTVQNLAALCHARGLATHASRLRSTGMPKPAMTTPAPATPRPRSMSSSKPASWPWPKTSLPCGTTRPPPCWNASA